jgi:hypothetical protein
VAPTPDPPEQRAVTDRRAGEPRLERHDRTEIGAALRHLQPRAAGVLIVFEPGREQLNAVGATHEPCDLARRNAAAEPTSSRARSRNPGNVPKITWIAGCKRSSTSAVLNRLASAALRLPLIFSLCLPDRLPLHVRDRIRTDRHDRAADVVLDVTGHAPLVRPVAGHGRSVGTRASPRPSEVTDEPPSDTVARRTVFSTSLAVGQLDYTFFREHDGEVMVPNV